MQTWLRPLHLVTTFLVTHFTDHTVTTCIFASNSRILHVCCTSGPCCISSDYLLFWGWWDGAGIGGQNSLEAEKYCIFMPFFFFLAIYILDPPPLPSTLHVCMYFKGGEVCLSDSDFLPEITFPRVGDLFLEGNQIS